jgi:hypothetical protein
MMLLVRPCLKQANIIRVERSGVGIRDGHISHIVDKGEKKLILVILNMS